MDATDSPSPDRHSGITPHNIYKKRMKKLEKEIDFNQNHAGGFSGLLTDTELKSLKKKGYILKGTEESWDLTPDGGYMYNANFLVFRKKDKVVLRFQDLNAIRRLARLQSKK